MSSNRFRAGSYSSPPFRLRDEADVLALVPFTFGFHPERSLVLITFEPPGRPFGARIDLPDDPGELDVVVEELMVAARRNGCGVDTLALVVVYTEEHELAELAATLLTVELETLGVDIITALRAADDRWFRLGVGVEGPAGDGVPFDLTSHQLTARSVVEGRVTFESREELSASLAVADADQAERVNRAHDELALLGDLSPSALAFEGRWLVGLAARPESATLSDMPLVARLLRDIAVTPLRDLVWSLMTRTNATEHVRLWTDVVRQAPVPLVAPAAGLLAFAAWLSGDGALAWCAVERSLGADPDHTLAHLVARALELAVPPTEWSPPSPPVGYAGRRRVVVD
jgi:hypothetical protein